MIDQSLLDLVGRPVPLYTSYPSAPFSEGGVSVQEYAVWLSAMSAGREPVSLYLHVPFCRELCLNPGEKTKTPWQNAPSHAYVQTLRRELELVAGRTGRLPISHIQWGGRTPSLLPERDFVDAVTAVFEFFDMSNSDREHAIELDPRYVDQRLATRLATYGVNRVSLEIQDTDLLVQALIGRPQTFNIVQEAFEHLHRAGIAEVDISLICGVPGQTPRSMAKTIKSVLSLRPGRLALPPYTYVPRMKSNRKRVDFAALPTITSLLELAQIARDLVAGAGYIPIGIDHYALPGDTLMLALAQRTLRRTLQGYTTDQAQHVIGLGASAIGRIPIGYVQNASDVAKWRAAIEAGCFATTNGRRLTRTDRMRAEVIGELMCFFSTDVGAIAHRHGRSSGVFAEDIRRLQPLCNAGFVRCEDNHVRLVADEPLLARIVASAFDRHLTVPLQQAVTA